MSEQDVEMLTKAIAEQAVIEAAIAERAAERACRNRPWSEREAWVTWVEAMLARREAVDALIRERGR